MLQKVDRMVQRVRRVGPPVPLAAFGALAGAISSIVAAEHQRETYYGPYYSPYHAPYGHEAYRRSPAPRASGREPAPPPALVTRPAAGTL